MRQFGSNIDVLAPGAFLSLIVPLVVFFAFQRYFVQGLMAGSVKSTSKREEACRARLDGGAGSRAGRAEVVLARRDVVRRRGMVQGCEELDVPATRPSSHCPPPYAPISFASQ